MPISGRSIISRKLLEKRIFETLIYDVDLQNQILIEREDDSHLSLRIYTVFCQTHLLSQHSHYRIDDFQKLFHLVQRCHMQFIDHSESCLIDQNHELLQDFVNCMIECEEKAKVLLDERESNDIFVGRKLFRLVLNVQT